MAGARVAAAIPDRSQRSPPHLERAQRRDHDGAADQLERGQFVTVDSAATDGHEVQITIANRWNLAQTNCHNGHRPSRAASVDLPIAFPAEEIPQ
jgi:hypothetical protein